MSRQGRLHAATARPPNHKFVVDFNDSKPVVFTGSSNLAAGGEKANQDNLLAIRDASIATAFAVEAVRLVRPATRRREPPLPSGPMRSAQSLTAPK